MPLIIDDLAQQDQPEPGHVVAGLGDVAGDDRLWLEQIRRGESDRPPGGTANAIAGMAERDLHFRPGSGGPLPVFTLAWFRQPPDPVTGLAEG